MIREWYRLVQWDTLQGRGFALAMLGVPLVLLGELAFGIALGVWPMFVGVLVAAFACAWGWKVMMEQVRRAGPDRVIDVTPGSRLAVPVVLMILGIVLPWQFQ